MQNRLYVNEKGWDNDSLTYFKNRSHPIFCFWWRKCEVYMTRQLSNRFRFNLWNVCKYTCELYKLFHYCTIKHKKAKTCATLQDCDIHMILIKRIFHRNNMYVASYDPHMSVHMILTWSVTWQSYDSIYIWFFLFLWSDVKVVVYLLIYIVNIYLSVSKVLKE